MLEICRSRSELTVSVYLDGSETPYTVTRNLVVVAIVIFEKNSCYFQEENSTAIFKHCTSSEQRKKPKKFLFAENLKALASSCNERDGNQTCSKAGLVQ